MHAWPLVRTDSLCWMWCSAAFALALKRVTNSIRVHDEAGALAALAVVGGCMLAWATSWSIGYRLSLQLREQTMLLLDIRLASVTARIPTH